MRPTHKSAYIVLIDSTDTQTDRRRQSNRVKTSSSCTPEKTEGSKAASRRNSSREEERLENFTDVEKHHSHEQNSKSGE
jgi:hypothetical protein